MFYKVFGSFILLVVGCYSRDALQHFIKHRKIDNFILTVLIDTNLSDVIWVEYKYHFKTDTNLDDKNNLNEVLIVGIFENPNALFDCSILKDENGTDSYKGYSFQVLHLLQEVLDFRVLYTPLDHSVIKLKNNLTKAFLQNNIDLLICHPDVVSGTGSDLVQLDSTLTSKYVLIYKTSNLQFTKDIFILTFAGTLWLCFLILLIILAVCLHISTKRYCLIYNLELWTWVDITLWANAAACQQGLSHTPKGFASRCIFFLGYLTSYLLYTGFAAGITSLLLQQSENNHISMSDFESMQFKIVTIMNRRMFNNSVTVENMEDLFDCLNQANTVGIAPKIFIEQYFARELKYDMIDLYSTTTLTDFHYSHGFVTLKNNSQRVTLNKGLSILREAGLLDNALYRSLLPTPSAITSSNYSSAGIEHLRSAILILVVGALSASVLLVIELIIALYRSRCYGYSDGYL